jgi:GGDEF domain-containing protein
MDDFRSQLSALIDEMLAAGASPVFLVIDLEGVEQIKKNHGAESLDKFHAAAISAVIAATDGADAFSYGDDRIVAILDGGFDRLKTFALSQKLRRVIPLLGQSFDCFLRPEFDIVEYDANAGVGALIARISMRRIRNEEAAG